MINILFQVYVFLIPFQFVKFENVTLLRVVGLLIILYFLIRTLFEMKIDKKVFSYAILLLIAPLSFIVFEIFRHQYPIGLKIYLPLIFNILIFISILTFKNIINFNIALNTLILSSFFSVILYFTNFVQVGDYCDPVKWIPSCHGIGRLSVLHLNPNESALLIATAFVGMMSKLNIGIATPFNKKSLFVLTLSLLCLVALGKNGTRFVLLIIFGYGIFILAYCFKTRSYSWLYFLTLTGGIFFSFVLLSKPIIVLRFIEFFEVFSFSISDGSRLHLWSVAINAVKSNYLFGIGVLDFSKISLKLFGSWMTPHNIFLEFLIYGGIFGFLFTIPYILLLLQPTISFKENFEVQSLRIGFIIICGSIMVLHHVFFNKLFWVLLIFVFVFRHGFFKK